MMDVEKVNLEQFGLFQQYWSPKVVEHLPIAGEEVQVLLLELETTLNTGNVQNERTIEHEERI